MKKNYLLDGMMGLVVGDALGVPVQFYSRDEIANRAQGNVKGMEGFGTFRLPAGSWSDDSSMSLATLDSIKLNKGINLDDIMLRFAKWNEEGAYTPYGFSYDQGVTCRKAIDNYLRVKDAESCGVTGEYANGNGALMRILPVCIFNILSGQDEKTAIKNVHDVTALTHNHLRSKICSGVYYFIAKRIIENERATEGELAGLIQEGIDDAYAFYTNDMSNHAELAKLGRIFKIEEFKRLPAEAIKSTGYVIDTIEAAVWCLVTTDSLEACLLKAVNLGDDTDTVAAIAGGIAGLYYGYESIPQGWLEVIAKRDWLEEMVNCDLFEAMQGR